MIESDEKFEEWRTGLGTFKDAVASHAPAKQEKLQEKVAQAKSGEKLKPTKFPNKSGALAVKNQIYMMEDELYPTTCHVRQRTMDKRVCVFVRKGNGLYVPSVDAPEEENN